MEIKSTSTSRKATSLSAKSMGRTHKRRMRAMYLPLIAAVASAVVSTRAANLTWDPTQNPSSPAGGAGTWDLATLNWSTGTVDQAWTDVSPTGTDTAIFGGTGGAVTLNTAVSALGLQFNATGYTISGSGNLTLGSGGINASALSSGNVTISKTIVLAADQTWTVGAGATLKDTVSTINGTGNLTVAGAGNVSLTNGGTISGVLNVTGTLLTSQDLHANGGLTGNGTISNPTTSDKWFFVTNTANQTFSGTILGGASKLGLNKSGNGTLTLTGANEIDDAVTVNAGTLVFSGNHLNTTQTDNVATTAGTNGVLILSNGSNFQSNQDPGQPWQSSINVSTNATSAGSLQNNGATFVVNRQLDVGGPSYGAYTQTAGNSTIGGFLAVGGTAQGGVFNLTGGTFTLKTGDAGAITVGFASNSAINGGVMNVGGTGTLIDNANSGLGLWIGEVNTGILNVSGNANITINSTGSGGGLVLGKNNTSNSHGIVNLNGGTLTTPSVTQGGTTGTSTFSFNGGTLKANANNTAFFTGVTNAYVYGNGGTIDDGGNSITIGQSFTAPTGNGVSASGLSVSGSGFIDTPLVSITGGGGSGATAVATIDSNGNLTGITITNPGTGYTSAPTFALVGGGVGNTGAIGGAATLVANTSGGITKVGSGTLTFTGANTYSGTTNITAGTLTVGSGGSISGPTTVTSGTLSGSGSVGNVTVVSSASNVIANTSGAVLTTGNITFKGTAALNLTVSSTSPVLTTSTLTTSNGGGVSTGKISVNVSNSGSWTSGVYDLVQYSSFGGVGFSDFIKGTIAGLGVRQSATLTNPAGFIALSIAGDSPKWTGALDGTWNTSNQTNPKNWQLITGGTPTDYIQGDTVLFDDSATNPNVHINSANVSPTTVTFNNSGLTYTINGPFGIAGATSVTLNGSGTVSLAAPSTYTGGTFLTNGVLNINNASAIGTGTLNISGGSIDNTSGSPVTLSTNNAINLTTDLTFNGTNDLNLGTGNLPLTGTNFNINGTANLTVGGVISGNYGITVQGSGTGALVLTGNNTNVGTTIIHSATLTVAGGTLGNLTNATDINISPAGTDSGTLMVTGGVVNASRVVIGGDSANTAGGNAKLIQTGGTINSNLWFTVGSGNPNGNTFPTGEYDLSGGTMNLIAQQMEVANFDGTTGIVNMSAGNINLENNTSLALGANNLASDGTFNQSGGNVTFYSNATAVGGTGILYLGKAGSLSGSTYTYNLTGGTLTVPQIQQTANNSATGILNLNGGTLTAAKANTNWISGLTTMEIGSNGATIDDGGFAVTVPQAISDNGGGALTKQGAGVLTLTAANTYAGQTKVVAGTLALTGAGAINSSSGILVNGTGAKFVQASSVAVSPTVTVSNGTVSGSNATISTIVVNSSANATVANGNNDTGVLTVGSLTFNGVGNIDPVLAGPAATTSPGIVTTTLTTHGGGKVTVNPVNSSWTAGAYDLISYTGAIGGDGFADFQLGTVSGLTPRQGVSLTNAGGFIVLNVTAGVTVTWTGALNNSWTTATLAAPKNWKVPAGTTDFITGDAVLFDDTGSNTSINISDASVSTTSMTFNNSAKNYSISSTGGFGITGGTLVKNGTGSLSLNTANSYAGGTTLNAGTLNINTTTAIGTGPLTITGGTLDNTSAGALTLTTNNVLNVNGDFAFAGTKDLNLGTANVTLGGAVGARTITATAGTLTVGPITGGAGYGLTIAGNGTVAINTPDTSNAVTEFTTVAGELTVQAGATFSNGNADTFFGGLAGAGTVTNNGSLIRWMTVGTDNSNTTFSGSITDGSAGLGLRKRGTGTLTLSGSTGYSSTTTIEGGTIVMSGSNNLNGLVQVGGGANITGALLMTGGSLSTGNELWLATGDGGYGYMNMSGGSATIGSWLALGRGGGQGVLDVTGNATMTIATNNLTLGSFGGSTGDIHGVATINGNATVTSNNAIYVGENTPGVMTVSGNAKVSALGTDGVMFSKNSATTGILNVNGGTVSTTSITMNLAGTSTLNLNGGTIKALGNTTTFINNVTNAYVYSGGVTVDDGGKTITIPQVLQAPTGSGISATGLTASGTGFIGEPVVEISGGGGSGATAVAVIDGSGNLTGITITNPGIGYTSAPTFTILGGGLGSNGSISGNATLVANVGGGLTKVGAGNVTLSAANTYTGGTTVSNGTLIAANVQALGTGAIAIHTGAKLQLQAGLAMAVVTPAVTFDGSTGAWSGQLDMTNDKMVVNPTVSKATALANLQNQAHSVITSSTMAANYGIAVIDNAVTGFATFGGQPVTSNSILISPELLGDANVDGVVNQADLNIVLSHFGSATAAWTSGNFDGAKTINLTDYADVINNFGKVNPSPSDISGSNGSAGAAPEPASLAVLALGASAMLTRRRKHGMVA